MVNEYLKTETLTDENMLICRHCKIKTPFERITRVIQTPSTLIIQLKRFTNDLEKVTDTIKVDRIISIDEAQYTLRSVQIHSGNFLMHGHYYTLTLEEEKIVCYNDELVNIEDKDIMTNTSIQNNAYILYYEQTDSHCVENLETDPVIGKIGSLLLYESNLECLDDGRWLNDQVINAYLAIIQRDHRDLVLCLDTFFLIEKKHDLKSIKSINTVDMVLIPVPSNNHWSLLVVQSKNQTVFVLDSSGVINMKAVEFIRSLYKKEFSIDLSYTKKLKHKISLQENGYDCGVFVLLYSEALAGGQTLCFTKNEIATARQRIRQRIMKAVIK
ncbi:uncharacterized protein [Mytilus edulis]|uniref:uncharacterized protein n=1 Tax=Mytilus edulis TaxID=6550 RepID=UPI0039EE6042